MSEALRILTVHGNCSGEHGAPHCSCTKPIGKYLRRCGYRLSEVTQLHSCLGRGLKADIDNNLIQAWLSPINSFTESGGGCTSPRLLAEKSLGRRSIWGGRGIQA